MSKKIKKLPTMTTLAGATHKALKVSKRDQAKCKPIILATRSAKASASNKLANSLHHVRSGAEFVRKDRIGSLANAIAKFSKINPKALTGGQKLKDKLLKRAWTAYAMLELQGLDNAHYAETTLPANEYGYTGKYDESENGFNDPDYRWNDEQAFTGKRKAS